ncbi:transposase [Nocardia arthritidis]|uniref:Transposase n=2 Tax=Nocardia arthritidis TaxID=228602 RepID=A0A6G9YR97_9NOCA|nr:transposase [Nocardia arthritidis]
MLRAPLVEALVAIRRSLRYRGRTSGRNRRDRGARRRCQARAPQPGGESAASRRRAGTVEAADPATQVRHMLVLELIEELETIDRKTKTVDKQLRNRVLDHGSTLMDLNGLGPSSAARLLADTGDIHRFATRDRFASWNGTAPLDASSGEQKRHRLSRAANRKINRVLHIMAVVQLRHPTAGRVYYDGRKASGKTSMEAMRALKRHLSNVVYQQMLADQRRRGR